VVRQHEKQTYDAQGIQRLDLPSFSFGTGVFGDDVAAINLSYKFNNNVSMTFFWMRPYNDNYVARTDTAANFAADRRNFGETNSLDNVDMFGLLVPLSFDGFKVTPWTMMGAIGPNTWRNWPAATGTVNSARQYVQRGIYPAIWSTNNGLAANGHHSKQYAFAWWAGLTGEITAADPFRFAWDFNYGSVNYYDAPYAKRQGWYFNVLAEYKLDWGVPGLYFWWGSGDDSSAKNGSERMPVLAVNTPANNLSSFGFNGVWQNTAIGNNGVLGQQFHAGSWGIGTRIRDMSFIEGLSHTFRVNFFGGTNAPGMAKQILGKKQVGGNNGVWAAGSEFNQAGGGGAANSVYLTTLDYGIEVNLDTTYKIYKNLELIVELGYIHLWLDQSKNMWGNGKDKYPGFRGVSVTDALKASAIFRYSF